MAMTSSDANQCPAVLFDQAHRVADFGHGSAPSVIASRYPACRAQAHSDRRHGAGPRASACRVCSLATSRFVLAVNGSPLHSSPFCLSAEVSQNPADPCRQAILRSRRTGRRGALRWAPEATRQRQLMAMNECGHPATSAMRLAMQFAADLTGSLARWGLAWSVAAQLIMESQVGRDVETAASASALAGMFTHTRCRGHPACRDRRDGPGERARCNKWLG